MSKHGESSSPPPPPWLWGEWRCTDDPRMFVADCAACGGSLWVHRRGFDQWRPSCVNGCAREAIEAASEELGREQAARMEYDDELRATMEPNDPFWRIDATRYIEALTGQQPSRGGFYRCPFHADGKERTPSLHATDILPARWYCFACQAGGTIYDFAALLWGIEPRREGFAELRERLGRELLRGHAEAAPMFYDRDGRPL